MKKIIATLLISLLALSGCGGSTSNTDPFIGENGNWWVGDTDTGVQAKGTDGATIIQIAYNLEHELVITMSDGKVYNLGKISNVNTYDIYTAPNSDINYKVLMTFDLGIYEGKACAILKNYSNHIGNDGADVKITVPAIFEGYPVVGVYNEGSPVIQDSNYEASKGFVLPETVKFIGDYAFAHTLIESIKIPDSVEAIGYNAFYNNTNLSKVEISSESNLEYVSSNAFDRCSALTSFFVPKNLIAMHSEFNGCTSLVKIDVDARNNRYYSVDGVLYRNISSPSSKELCCYPEGKKVDTFIIPKEVDKINLFTGVNYKSCALDSNYLKNIYWENRNTPLDLSIGSENSTATLESFVVPKETDHLYIYFPYLTSALKIFYEGTEDEMNALKDAGNIVTYTSAVTMYYYSQEESIGSWRYVEGIPTIWE